MKEIVNTWIAIVDGKPELELTSECCAHCVGAELLIFANKMKIRRVSNGMSREKANAEVSEWLSKVRVSPCTLTIDVQVDQTLSLTVEDLTKSALDHVAKSPNDNRVNYDALRRNAKNN